MRRTAIGIVTIVLLGAAPARAQQADVKETGAMLGKGFAELSGWILKSAEMVPADKYSYKPTATVRTFGELLGHIADGANYYCGRAAGKKIQWSDAIAHGKTDKATVVPKVKEALDACAPLHGSGGLPMLIQSYGHANLHYGNMITYLRMMGLVPPSS